MKRINQSSPDPVFCQTYQAEHFVTKLAHSLYLTLLPKWGKYDCILLCIGTDRSTGDALGPLVGSQLTQKTNSAFHIYGTLEEPVHALNLPKTLTTIHVTHHHPFIIAIDACLGQYDHVGQITLGYGPLKPGAAVQKKLPEVGDMHLTGIVNVGGFMEYFVLQNTRLSIVMQMAQKIADAFSLAALHLEKQHNSRHTSFAPIQPSSLEN
jgi:putative sporulation protein YyaC